VSTLLKLAGPHHEDMIKQALIGSIARSGLNLIRKHPVKSGLAALGGAFNASSVVEGTRKMNDMSGVGRSLGNFATNTAGRLQTM
jgi:hypothetical protein